MYDITLVIYVDVGITAFVQVLQHTSFSSGAELSKVYIVPETSNRMHPIKNCFRFVNKLGLASQKQNSRQINELNNAAKNERERGKEK